MPARASTLCIDFTLRSFPELETVKKLIVTPLEKLTKSSFETSIIKDIRLTTLTCTAQEPSDVFVLIRIYNKAFETENVLMTVTVECSSAIEDLIDIEEGSDLEEVVRSQFEYCFGSSAEVVNFFPSIKRCMRYTPYLTTSDDRLIEYGFKKVIYHERSPYQLIQIYETVDLGKLLVLDEMTNLAESDTEPYTHHLMCLPQGFASKYSDSEVLILGGGDGACLKELLELKAPPSFVTMIEIDEMVMNAVSTYMPSVCGSYLRKEHRRGSRHEIIVGDAIAFMKEKIKEGKTYDFIFGDLTDTPVSSSSKSKDSWCFLREIIELGIKLLKPETGTYMTHCNGKSVPQILRSYETMLQSLHNGKCTFTSSEKFVPSFMEIWVYYQIQRHE